MVRITILASVFGATHWLSSCSTPEQPASTSYRQDLRISSSADVPRDSSASYFPADASADINPDSLGRRIGDCKFKFELLSKDLFWFNAPVLSNYYPGHSIYRFLWSPAFRLPVLLTMEINATGGVLKTRFLNRAPQAMHSRAQVEAESKPELERINELKSLLEAGQHVAENQERLASATDRLNDIKLSGTPLIITEKTTALSQRQVQEFIGLLDQAKFWQLVSCEPTGCFDGGNYTLEAHEADRYHMVSRGCLMEHSEGIYQCCKFLLDRSPAKP